MKAVKRWERKKLFLELFLHFLNQLMLVFIKSVWETFLTIRINKQPFWFKQIGLEMLSFVKGTRLKHIRSLHFNFSSTNHIQLFVYLESYYSYLESCRANKKKCYRARFYSPLLLCMHCGTLSMIFQCSGGLFPQFRYLTRYLWGLSGRVCCVKEKSGCHIIVNWIHDISVPLLTDVLR